MCACRPLLLATPVVVVVTVLRYIYMCKYIYIHMLYYAIYMQMHIYVYTYVLRYIYADGIHDTPRTLYVKWQALIGCDTLASLIRWVPFPLEAFRGDVIPLP